MLLTKILLKGYNSLTYPLFSTKNSTNTKNESLFGKIEKNL
jgi:hypothetical protein